MTNERTRIVLLLGAFLLSAGGEGGGCDCDCDWGSGKPPVRQDNSGSGWVETEPSPPIAAQPLPIAADPIHAVAVKSQTVKQTAVYCDDQSKSCSPVPIRRVKVARGLWPEWYVRNTPHANLNATWDCNRWARGTNPVIKPGQEIGICGW